MQTFLTSPSFALTASELDSKRLFKQLVEAKQIIQVLEAKEKGENPAWKHHPAVLMWKGHINSLAYYGGYLAYISIKERKYEAHKLHGWFHNKMDETLHNPYPPKWLEDERFLTGMRNSLYHKDPKHYSQYKTDDLRGYFWPSKHPEYQYNLTQSEIIATMKTPDDWSQTK